MNIYPVMITDQQTEVGYANWGNGANERAKEQANTMQRYARMSNEFIYDVIFVTAKTRAEVVKNYEV